MSTAANRRVAIWLLACAVLVFAMVVLGGVTRLTRSGLSIVEWKPVAGAIPPLTHSAWVAEFEKYKQTPEYLHVNRDMDLAGFQRIFRVEYSHRLLGRTIGVAFLLPLLWFAATRQIDRALAVRLGAIFVLGGAQGALGWYMVKSGLVNDPHVSPYRLTAHLGLAVIIYGLLVASALRLLDIRRTATVPGIVRAAWLIAALVFLMILSGGFVAGTKAGFAFNTFPLMYGRLVPEGLFALDPWWRNFFENLPTVQFDHRLIAYLLCVVIPAYWFFARSRIGAGAARAWLHLLPLALALQVALGIATLLLVVPVTLAAAHQAGAMAVFTVALLLALLLQATRSPR
jgi:cytochrome c oxidase assembly protein subunit 15